MRLRHLGLATQVLVGISGLFVVILVTLSLLSAWNLDRQLTRQFESKGLAIANSIANSSIEPVLGGDGSALQAMIDGFLEIQGVGYIFVVDDDSVVISHTFVPSVPKQLLDLQARHDHAVLTNTVSTLQIPDMGSFVDITAPILAGVAGTVHVGMDRRFIASEVRQAVVVQDLSIVALFAISLALAYAHIARVAKPLRVLTAHAEKAASPAHFQELADHHATEAPIADRVPTSVWAAAEVSALSTAFQDMERELMKYIADLSRAQRSRDELVGLRRELEIAAAIQRSLLPRGLPPESPAGAFDIYGVVVPATEVGGDFYDYFMIDRNRVGVVVADVAGKGVGAAIYMALSSTLLRAAALDGSAMSAGQVVARLNGLLCLAADAGMFVTVCYAVLNLDTGDLDYATAGHPPPFLITTGEVRALPKATGSVVGMMDDLEYASLQTRLAPGAALVLFSDGVNEAMNEQSELFGLERAAAFLAGTPRLSSEATTAAMIAEVNRFAGTAPQADDITVLVIRYQPGPGKEQGRAIVTDRDLPTRIALTNDIAELSKLSSELDAFGATHALSDEVMMALGLSLEEVITNVISYSFDGGSHPIGVELAIENGAVRATVTDEGREYNPLLTPEPDVEAPLEDREIGGLGVLLVKRLMDEVSYARDNGRNILTVRKRL